MTDDRAAPAWMWFSTAGMERGSFWLAAGTSAPMYVEWSGPEPDSDRPPLVLIHGGGGQGTDWLITPDGRPGWAPLLADRGHRVYVIDRPGHGRGAAWGAALGELGPPPAIPWLATLFRPDPGVHPTAHLQTQWPAPGGPPEGDPALAQILCSSRAMPVDLAASHELERRAGAELLDRVGPAILCTHSAGGPAGWLSAAERPDLVRAIVALEPLGPPYRAPDQGLPLPRPDGDPAARPGRDPGPARLRCGLRPRELRRGRRRFPHRRRRPGAAAAPGRARRHRQRPRDDLRTQPRRGAERGHECAAADLVDACGDRRRGGPAALAAHVPGDAPELSDTSALKKARSSCSSWQTSSRWPSSALVSMYPARTRPGMTIV